MRAEFLMWAPRIRRGILLGIVGGVPILFLRTGVDPFNVPKLAFLITGLGAATALRTAELVQGSKIRVSRHVVVAGAALVGALAIAWMFSPYRSWAMLGQFGRFQGLLPYALVVLLSLLVYDSFLEDVRPVVWTVVISAAVVSAYALIQTIGADPFVWNAFGAPTRAISTLGNPNFTGGLLAMALPLCAGLAVTETTRSGTAVRLGLLIAAGWIAARSEGAWGGGVAGLVTFGGIYFAHRRPMLRRLGYATAVALALGVVAVGVVGASRNLPFVPHTLELRGGWWLSAGRMAADHPLVGAGPNAYAIEGVQYRGGRDAEELGYNFTDDPHSFPMSLVAGAGLLGAAAYVVLAGSVIRRTVQVSADDITAAAIAGALVAYLVQGLASIDELSLRVAFWGLLPCLFANTTRTTTRDGKRARSTKKARERVRSVPLRHAWSLPMLAGVAVASLVGSGVLLAADQRVQQGRATSSRRPGAGAGHFVGGIGIRADPYYRYLYGLDAGNAAVESKDDRLLAQAEAAFDYLDGFPDVRGLVGYARILHEWTDATGEDRESDALELFRRAMTLDPWNPMIRVETADVLIAMGEFEEARAVVEPAIELVGTDSHPEVWGALALIHARTGATSEAEEAIGIARALNPDDARAAAAADLLEEP